MIKQKICLVVDRSGSMAGKEEDTVGGINSCLDELKENLENNNELFVSLKLFDHKQEIFWHNKNIKENLKFDKSNFIPRGQTALLDAIGDTINEYIDLKKENVSNFDLCTIYITTDGYENCSKKYDKIHISSLIKEAEEKYNITVMYLAANQDAIFEASNLGIMADRAINYSETSENIDAVYRSAARSAARTRSGEATQFLPVERAASYVNYDNNACKKQCLDNSNLVMSPPPLTRNRGRSTLKENIKVSIDSKLPNTDIDIPEWKKHTFCDAAKMGNWPAVKGFLEEFPQLINVSPGIPERWTVLHQAAYKNNEEVVRYLISKGADIYKRNRDNILPMDLTGNDVIRNLLQ